MIDHGKNMENFKNNKQWSHIILSQGTIDRFGIMVQTHAYTRTAHIFEALKLRPVIV